MNRNGKMKIVSIGQYEVPVAIGGFYDRYRMEPDLDAIKNQITFGTVEFFNRFPKAPVAFEGSGLGEVMMPCFYYESSYIQAVFTANAKALRKLLPTSELEPLAVFPGIGLLAVVVMNHRKTDIDAYNESIIAVITKTPGKRTYGLFSVLANQRRRENWLYVWKMPVSTEIACISGVKAYNYPKHVTAIAFEERANEVIAGFKNQDQLEITLTGRKIPTRKGGTMITHTNSFKDGKILDVPIHTNILAAGQSYSKKSCSLNLGEGPIADTLRGVGIGQLVRYDYVPKAQLVLPPGTFLSSSG